MCGRGSPSPRVDKFGIQRYLVSGDHHPPWIYKSFAGRLTSYNRILPSGKQFSWNNPFISAYDLAKSGFYAVGDEDKVECAFCQVGLHMFVKGNF